MGEWVERQISFRWGEWEKPDWEYKPPTECITRIGHDLRFWTTVQRVRSPPILQYLNARGVKFPIDMWDWSESKGGMIRFAREVGSKYGILWPVRDYDGLRLPDDNTPWDEKEDVLFWRGSITGQDETYRLNPIKMILSQDLPLRSDCKFSQVVQNRGSWVTPDMMGAHLPMKDQFRYKYLLSLEGNTTASHMQYIFNSNSLCLHTYPFRWENILFGDNPMPWVHFVPVAHDCSDLPERLKWCMENQDECKKITERARAYIQPYKDPHLYNQVLEGIVKKLK